ncbi:MAG: hypothetical protein JWM74_5014 [Myxococcaceae bacterium]|nr:hypothetical protein [Myxococcaceae bacterium]
MPKEKRSDAKPTSEPEPKHDEQPTPSSAEKFVEDSDPNPPWLPDYKAPKGTRERHAEAYRTRAGMIGTLATCICTWPLDEDATTITGHDRLCPSEGMAQRKRASA